MTLIDVPKIPSLKLKGSVLTIHGGHPVKKCLEDRDCPEQMPRTQKGGTIANGSAPQEAEKIRASTNETVFLVVINLSYEIFQNSLIIQSECNKYMYYTILGSIKKLSTNFGIWNINFQFHKQILVF